MTALPTGLPGLDDIVDAIIAHDAARLKAYQADLESRSRSSSVYTQERRIIKLDLIETALQRLQGGRR